MRPGGLARRGVGSDECRAVNPRIVFCSISGYGATGPYRDLPSHGIAYDTWAGLVEPEVTADGFCEMPPHPNVGINVGPLYGALGILAGVVQARSTGEGCTFEVAQSDAAAVDGLAGAGDRTRPTSGPSTRSPATAATATPAASPARAGMRGGVRYQIYESADGHVLFMASEQAFWKNFCERHRPARAVRGAPRCHLRRPRPRRRRAPCRAA